MARGTTQAEREAAVTVISPGEDDLWDDDVEKAFRDWRSSFDQGEEPGKLRAYQIPLDSRGNPIANTKNQVLLGSWPIDLYGYDELCMMLVRDFMTPEKILAVRMIGTEAGKPGIKFNKILILRAPKNAPAGEQSNGRGESTTDIMRAINENNEKLMGQFRAMLPPPAQHDPRAELRQTLELAAILNKPSQDLMTQLVPALVGRPTTASDPFAMMGGLADLIGKIMEMRGGDGGGESSGNDIVDAIRAIVPIAKPAIEAIPAIVASRMPAQPQQSQLSQRGPPRVLPPGPPQIPRPPNAPTPPGMVPTQQTPQPAQPVSQTTIGDIPSEDQQMLLKLKQQIDELVAVAAGGSEPVGTADMIFEQFLPRLDDDDYERLYDLLKSGKFVIYAAAFNPGVMTHRQWFEALAGRVVERYDAEEQAQQTAPTTLQPGQ